MKQQHLQTITCLWGLVLFKCFTIESLAIAYEIPIHTKKFVWLPSFFMASLATIIGISGDKHASDKLTSDLESHCKSSTQSIILIIAKITLIILIISHIGNSVYDQTTLRASLALATLICIFDDKTITNNLRYAAGIIWIFALIVSFFTSQQITYLLAGFSFLFALSIPIFLQKRIHKRTSVQA